MEKGADTESYDSWSNFLSGLRERGIQGVACVTSDAHEGLKCAIAETFLGAAWQRCIVHLERNVAKLMCDKRRRAMALKALQSVFRESDPSLVRAAYHAAINAIAKMNAKAAELLEEAECDALAYLDFPRKHHRRLRTNNVQERKSRDQASRSGRAGVFS